MARAKKHVELDPLDAWRAIQLTPDQKAELRADAEKRGQAAGSAGAYEEFAQLEGKIKWSMSYEEMVDKTE